MIREKMKDGTTRLSGLTLNDIMLALNPVGSIHMSVDPTNPGTIFGGTWVAWGSGRVPVGVDAGDASFDTVEETGGHKDLQAHDHNGATGLQSANHSHGFTYSYVDTTQAGAAQRRVNAIQTSGGMAAVNTGGVSANHSHAISNDGTGDSGNLQPYITCYMWKRTA